MKKPIIVLVLVGLLSSVIFAFYAFNKFIYDKKQEPGEQVAPYEATLTGEYVCLTNRDTSRAQTFECAFGLKTDSGEYYALDYGVDGDVTKFVAGEKATISGMITPVVLLSTNHWQQYDIEGIFSVQKLDETTRFSESETQALEAAIQNQLIAKHGLQAETLTVSVSEISGNYAKGLTNEIGIGGGQWFAAKSNDVWQIVYDGNGIVLCKDLEQYPDYPSSLMPQCFDDNQGILINR